MFVSWSPPRNASGSSPLSSTEALSGSVIPGPRMHLWRPASASGVASVDADGHAN